MKIDRISVECAMSPSLSYLFWQFNTVAVCWTKTGMAMKRQCPKQHATQCPSILDDAAVLIRDTAHFDIHSIIQYSALLVIVSTFAWLNMDTKADVLCII